MIRTLITLLSIAFSVAWFLWTQLHWTFLQERNDELMVRLSSVTTICVDSAKRTETLMNERRYLAQQLYIFEQKRTGRKKYLGKLRKLIQKRNVKFGIGGR